MEDKLFSEKLERIINDNWMLYSNVLDEGEGPSVLGYLNSARNLITEYENSKDIQKLYECKHIVNLSLEIVQSYKDDYWLDEGKRVNGEVKYIQLAYDELNEFFYNFEDYVNDTKKSILKSHESVKKPRMPNPKSKNIKNKRESKQ